MAKCEVATSRRKDAHILGPFSSVKAAKEASEERYGRCISWQKEVAKRGGQWETLYYGDNDFVIRVLHPAGWEPCR